MAASWPPARATGSRAQTARCLRGVKKASGGGAYNDAVMKLRHWFLVAIFAMLQGMAPLLHAHLGGDRGGATGVHMHGAPSQGHGDAAALDVSHALPDESPAIGVGQELRRKGSFDLPDLATAPAEPVALPSAARRWSVPLPAEPTYVGRAPRLTPPAQAPPLPA